MFLFHGTQGLKGDGEPEDHWSDDFIAKLASELGISVDNIEILDWGGALSQSTRRDGGHNIATKLSELEHNGPLLLIGYSHGGNVAIRTINQLATEYNQDLSNLTLVTIGTPVRELNNEYVLYESIDINHHINIYNIHDIIQIAGGPAPLLQEGTAGRRFSDENRTENINVESITETGPFASHSYMHDNIRVWRDYILEALRRVLD